MKITRQCGNRKPVEIEFSPTFVNDNGFVKIFGNSINFSKVKSDRTKYRFEIAISLSEWEMLLEQKIEKISVIKFRKFSIDIVTIDLQNIKNESDKETIIVCGQGGRESSGVGYLYKIYIPFCEIPGFKQLPISDVQPPVDLQPLASDVQPPFNPQLPEPDLEPPQTQYQSALPEIISYDQLIKLVIDILGKEGCEKIRSSMKIDSLSSSGLLFCIFKKMGIVQPRINPNADQDWQEELYNFTISNKGKRFCVLNFPKVCLEIVFIDMCMLENYNVAVAWKSLVVDEICKCVQDTIGPINSNANIDQANDQLLENDLQLAEAVEKAMKVGDIKELCLLEGFKFDTKGVNKMICKIASEAMHSHNLPYYNEVIKTTLTEQSHKYGVESLIFSVSMRWRPEILVPILDLIESKIQLKIDPLLRDSLQTRAYSYEDNLISSIGIANLFKANFGDELIKRLRTALYGKKDKYKYIPHCMIRQLICELGFYAEEAHDLVYLTEKGKEFGVVSDENMYLQFLGWKPTIIPLIVAYMKNKLDKEKAEF